MSKQNTAQIRIYPSLALKMLDSACRLKGKPAISAFRLYLICKHLDSAGAGAVLYEALQAATRHIISKDWLDRLLVRGAGVFWNTGKRADGSMVVWLTGTARLAAYTGLERFSGKPVQIPSNLLYGSLANLKAGLYSTFDASRDPQPITRKTKASITNVSARTQQRYEKKTATAITRNFAILDRFTQHRLAMHRIGDGTAAFLLVDVNGRLGSPDEEYIAKQLPNTYTPNQATHTAIETHSANKRFNKLIKKYQSLCTMLDAGNIDTADKIDKLFHDEQIDCVVSGDGYWRKHQTKACGVWFLA